MRTILAVLLGLGLAALSTGSASAQSDGQKLDPNELTPEQRLKVLLATVEPYELTLEGSAKPLTLHSNPLLRFDNSVGGVVDGVVLMWTDGSRPAALAQIFAIKSKLWLHEFQSMADRPLTLKDSAKTQWQPKRAGGEFHPVLEGPGVESTRSGRLSQMKTLARRFAVSEDFRAQASDKETTKYELRMLPQPAYRYPETSKSSDGAIFAFVHGTDPEAMLTLECPLEGEDRGWKYAWAPLTCWAVQARLGDKQVWSAPEMMGKNSATQPYHIWSVKPDPAIVDSIP